MTDSQALQAEQLAGVIAASATAAHRRRRHGPAPRRDCGARRGDRRRGQAEARVSSPPACAPRGACLRRARLRRLRSGPASTGGAGGALVSPVALRSASQAVRLREASPAPGRRRMRRASREEAAVTPHAQSRVLSRGLPPSAWSLAGGASPPPRPPAPCGRGSARPAPAASHARYGHPGRAARPGAQSARGRTAPGAPYARMASTPSRRAGALFPRAAPGLGGRRAPGRYAVAGGRAFSAPWPRLRPVAVTPPRRYEGRCGGSRLARRCRSRCTAAGARLAGRPGTCSRPAASASARARPVLTDRRRC